MNRAERRRMKKQGKSPAINLAQSGTIPERKDDDFCRRHPLKLDNPQEPTERDKRLIDSVRYKIKKRDDEDGRTHVIKQCPRCFHEVEIDIIKRPLLAE